MPRARRAPTVAPISLVFHGLTLSLLLGSVGLRWKRRCDPRMTTPCDGGAKSMRASGRATIDLVTDADLDEDGATGDLDAGDYAAWRARLLAGLDAGTGSEVPCGTCTACCTSGYFVHVE